MRSIFLRSLLVIGAGGLILAGVLYVASTVDARPPEVLEVNLTQTLGEDARRALITTSLEVVFSEPVDKERAAAALALEPAVPGSVSWSGSTLTFTPDDPLELETRYSVRVGEGVRDVSGNEMTELPAPFEFATAGRPSLVDTTPADGASDVALDEPLELTFSTLMDTASVESQLRLRPGFAHELRWSGELLQIVPSEPLRPAMDYVVTVQADAADVAGVEMGEPIELRFRTVAPGLVVDILVPADGIEGIATTSPVAVIFDRPIDPDSVSGDLLTITPDVAGTLEVERLPDDPESDDGTGRLLRFTPSGPLAPNTTFSIELVPGIASTTGGRLAGPTTWSFTTGAPQVAISNQITFISDRAGVDNVWAMNSDGSGKRQLSTELVGVLDYAVAPDGGSLVMADGRRLVYERADGSDRRVLTDDGVIEFDPAYAPNGQRIAFGRADAQTGAGLGLWEWEPEGGEPTPIVLPAELLPGPAPSGSGDPPTSLRAPRYSPDGTALAFVDLTGWIGLLELPAERLTRVPFDAAAAPLWLPDSGSVLLTGRETDGSHPAPPLEAPVASLAPAPRDEVFRLARSGTSVNPTPFGRGSHALAVAPDGMIAFVDADGALSLADLPTSTLGPPVLPGERVVSGAFAPGESAMVIVVAADAERGSIEVFDLDDQRRTALEREGLQPRWLP